MILLNWNLKRIYSKLESFLQSKTSIFSKIQKFSKKLQQMKAQKTLQHFSMVRQHFHMKVKKFPLYIFLLEKYNTMHLSCMDKFKLEVTPFRIIFVLFWQQLQLIRLEKRVSRGLSFRQITFSWWLFISIFFSTF